VPDVSVPRGAEMRDGEIAKSLRREARRRE
jgi:hypothetical protein